MSHSLVFFIKKREEFEEKHSPGRRGNPSGARAETDELTVL